MSHKSKSSQPSPGRPAADASLGVINSPSRVFRTPSKSEGFSWTEYIRVEMFGVGDPGHFEPQVTESIQNFLIVPMRLEGLMVLGLVTCLDAFLYVLTFLPIRVVFSTILLFHDLQGRFCTMLFGSALPPLFTFKGSPLRFHRTQAYDLLRGAMLTISCGLLMYVNMSQVYHFIRGQSFLKLYVLAGMMEVVDKLLSAFGQDTFDALHWQMRFDPKSLKLIFLFFVALCYVCVHSVLYFFVVATFTVVMNSADEALVTVLVINNFSEIRSFVFKKFDGNNLFQLACLDITERFQIVLFLSIIFLVTVAQAGSLWREAIVPFLKVASLMIVAETIADGMKHAFINKFNSVNANVYFDFAYVLRSDILNNRKDPIILDHTYAVTRRLGMSQLALGSVFLRYVALACSAPGVAVPLQTMSTATLALWGAICFGIALVIKLLLGVALLWYADYAQRKDSAYFMRSCVEVVKTFPRLDKLEMSSKKKSVADSIEDLRIQERIKFVEGLAEMDRYTVYKGKVV